MLPNNDPKSPGTTIEPQCALFVMCCECGQGIELPLPIDQRALAFLLAERAWFISVLSPPGQDPEAQTVLGPLCTACAQQVYPAEVFAVAEQRRQQLLQEAQAAGAPMTAARNSKERR